MSTALQPKRKDAGGSRPHVVIADNLHVGHGLSLRDVRGDDSGQRQQTAGDYIEGSSPHKRIAGSSNHHGVDDEGNPRCRFQLYGDGSCNLGIAYHSRLYGHWGDIGKNSMKLRNHHCHRHIHDLMNAEGVLSRHGGDHTASITA